MEGQNDVKKAAEVGGSAPDNGNGQIDVEGDDLQTEIIGEEQEIDLNKCVNNENYKYFFIGKCIITCAYIIILTFTILNIFFEFDTNEWRVIGSMPIISGLLLIFGNNNENKYVISLEFREYLLGRLMFSLAFMSIVIFATMNIFLVFQNVEWIYISLIPVSAIFFFIFGRKFIFKSGIGRKDYLRFKELVKETRMFYFRNLIDVLDEKRGISVDVAKEIGPLGRRIILKKQKLDFNPTLKQKIILLKLHIILNSYAKNRISVNLKSPNSKYYIRWRKFNESYQSYIDKVLKFINDSNIFLYGEILENKISVRVGNNNPDYVIFMSVNTFSKLFETTYSI